MKQIIYLSFLILITSCYKETNDFPYEKYIGNWRNDLTTINGRRDNIHPYNTVPHYSFSIAQSEVTLSTETSIGTQYHKWKVDNTTTPATLLLWISEIKPIPDMVFKITKEPDWQYMEITYQDSIVYQLFR